MTVSERATRPSIPADRYADRLARVRRLAAARGVAGILIGVGADLRYLTGYDAELTERLTMLALTAKGPASLVAPRLEAMAAADCLGARLGAVEIVAWGETDDPAALVAELLQAAWRLAPTDPLPTDRGRVLVSDRLWAMHVLALQRALPGASLGLATEVLRDLRMVKDADEVELLRAAAHAADRVIDAIARGPLVGRTEADVAREVRSRLLAEGHDVAEFAIVGSGPNSASPHHGASERVIAAGEPIVLDIGGSLGGYCSDTTRTLWVTGGDASNGPDPEFRQLYELVREAQAAATAAAKPGVSCQAIDATARNLIDAGGYGPAFIHRTGHGIGLETHEEPYLVDGNPEPLAAGTAFSVEPGIYLDGRYGARVEDIVVCGPDGPIVLNESSRDLRVVNG